MKDGIYKDLSNEDYHSDFERYSKSSLSDFSEYPHYMIEKRLSRSKRSKILDIGTAAHTAILEPDKLDTDVIIIPGKVLSSAGRIGTNKYKEWEQSIDATKPLLKEHEYDAVMRMRDSVFKDPNNKEAAEFLTGGLPEVSFYWSEKYIASENDEERLQLCNYDTTDELHTVKLKCRPDYIPAPGIVVDLKTYGFNLTDYDKLMKQSYQSKYHWSAALTLRGMSITTQKKHSHYYFVFVEKKHPFKVAVKTSKTKGDEYLKTGRVEVMEVLGRLAYCDYHNHWPKQPKEMSIPWYGIRKAMPKKY